ncbi:hypothetical protein [Corynebacterium fournieri]
MSPATLRSWKGLSVSSNLHIDFVCTGNICRSPMAMSS